MISMNGTGRGLPPAQRPLVSVPYQAGLPLAIFHGSKTSPNTAGACAEGSGRSKRQVVSTSTERYRTHFVNRLRMLSVSVVGCSRDVG